MASVKGNFQVQMKKETVGPMPGVQRYTMDKVWTGGIVGASHGEMLAAGDPAKGEARLDQPRHRLDVIGIQQRRAEPVGPARDPVNRRHHRTCHRRLRAHVHDPGTKIVLHVGKRAEKQELPACPTQFDRFALPGGGTLQRRPVWPCRPGDGLPGHGAVKKGHNGGNLPFGPDKIQLKV